MADDDDVDIYGGLPDFNFDKKLQDLELQNGNLRKRAKELECKVQSLESTNHKLSKQVKSLHRNISVLYATALAEIEHKNKMLADLQRERDSILFRRSAKTADHQPNPAYTDEPVPKLEEAVAAPVKSRKTKAPEKEREVEKKKDDEKETKRPSRTAPTAERRHSKQKSIPGEVKLRKEENTETKKSNIPNTTRNQRDGNVPEETPAERHSDTSTESGSSSLKENLKESKIQRAERLHREKIEREGDNPLAVANDIRRLSPRTKQVSNHDHGTSDTEGSNVSDLISSLLESEKERIKVKSIKKRKNKTVKVVCPKDNPDTPGKFLIEGDAETATPKELGNKTEDKSLSPEFCHPPETPGKYLNCQIPAQLENSPTKRAQKELDSAVFSILPTPLKMMTHHPLLLSPLQNTPVSTRPLQQTKTPEKEKVPEEPVIPAQQLISPNQSLNSSVTSSTSTQLMIDLSRTGNTPKVKPANYPFKRKRVLKIKCTSVGNSSTEDIKDAEPPAKKVCAVKQPSPKSAPTVEESVTTRQLTMPKRLPIKSTAPPVEVQKSPMKKMSTPQHQIQAPPASVPSTGRKSNDSGTSQDFHLHYTSESEISRSPSPFVPQNRPSAVATSTPHPTKSKLKLISNSHILTLTPRSKKKQKKKIIMAEMFGSSPASERDYPMDMEVTDDMRKDLEGSTKGEDGQEKKRMTEEEWWHREKSRRETDERRRRSPARIKYRQSPDYQKRSPSPLERLRKRTPEDRDRRRSPEREGRRSPDRDRRIFVDRERRLSPEDREVRMSSYERERRRSPEERKWAPEMRKKQVEERKRSPELRRRSPEGRKRSPEERKRSPDVRRRSPELRRRSPEIRRRSPEARRRSPEARRRSPEARRRSPEARRRSPEYRRKSPELRKRSPEEKRRRSPGDVERRKYAEERRKSPEFRDKRKPIDDRDRRQPRRSRSVERSSYSSSSRKSPGPSYSKKRSPDLSTSRRSPSPYERRDQRDFSVSPAREESRRKKKSLSPPSKLNGSYRNESDKRYEYRSQGREHSPKRQRCEEKRLNRSRRSESEDSYGKHSIRSLEHRSDREVRDIISRKDSPIVSKGKSDLRQVIEKSRSRVERSAKTKSSAHHPDLDEASEEGELDDSD
ncbi:serine/arginine repetitive matrix protein 2-like [Neocloeon triangulifer]|uniref:serine/arginine repetitive matrix protein 2-like n=1 Tax=Neocloeon triangulifer TaxID=2078957 RepID=UPI00286F8A6F|nr:serine/arginine repetitive matrix protein 2-like [Neocloeon triangulifer]